MSKIFTEYSDEPTVVGKDAEVTDQHPFPVRIEYQKDGVEGWTPSTEADGMPVKTTGITKITTKLTVVRQPIPGIGTGAAYATGDSFGTAFTLQVPVEGTIATVTFRDYDNEGLPKEIWLFSENFTQTADNAAFAPTDIDLFSCVGVISIATFYAANGNQVGIVTPALYYFAPKGLLYGQLVTRGADNIAAGSIPDFTLVIT